MDQEGWLQFFLRGVAETAAEATDTARAIVRLRDEHRRLIQDQGLGINGLRLLDLLFHYLVVNVTLVKDRLDIAFVTANKLVKQLETLGLVDEVTGGKKNRIFRYSPYLNLFDPRDTDPDDDRPLQSTKIGRSLLDDAEAN